MKLWRARFDRDEDGDGDESESEVEKRSRMEGMRLLWNGWIRRGGLSGAACEEGLVEESGVGD